MRRRDIIKGIAGSAIWPLAARAQQSDRMRRIGVLMGYAENDPIGQVSVLRFRQGLEDLGWNEGRNLRIDYRWGESDPDRLRNEATELVALSPDVLFGAGPTVRPLQQATRTIPIVFATVVDPVGGGYVESLARPGGNTTGFAESEYGVSGKWLELLKEIAPNVKRAAVIRNPNVPGGFGQLKALQGMAPSLGIQLSPVDLRDADEIERAITKFAGEPDGGLIVTSRTSALLHRDLIVSLAARYRLPAVYPDRVFVTVNLVWG
jgi:putative tryptophan/tyrosine transport system substrate-binding protein